jgi:hypothetical protein
MLLPIDSRLNTALNLLEFGIYQCVASEILTVTDRGFRVNASVCLCFIIGHATASASATALEMRCKMVSFWRGAPTIHT